jgi:hypothetical protein
MDSFVPQVTLNQQVAGSIPTALTIQVSEASPFNVKSFVAIHCHGKLVLQPP